MNGNGQAAWAEAGTRVTAFLAGRVDYPQATGLAADVAALRAYGLDRQRDWRSRVLSAEQALSAMRRVEAEAAAAAERVRQAAVFKTAYRPAPAIERLTGRGINAGIRCGRSNTAERARREVNRAARAADNSAAAEGFGCGTKKGG
ncbi:hypothetical protein HYZ80_01525 [Candidatus Parcubacteria bacterium]|nr:hypothetical protein [Candidatus Parcubacteria bacterium]